MTCIEFRETQENVIGHLERSRNESHEQYWHLGNALVGESERDRQYMGVMSDRVKALEEILAKFLSSNERIDYKSEDGQHQLHVFSLDFN